MPRRHHRAISRSRENLWTGASFAIGQVTRRLYASRTCTVWWVHCGWDTHLFCSTVSYEYIATGAQHWTSLVISWPLAVSTSDRRHFEVTICCTKCTRVTSLLFERLLPVAGNSEDFLWQLHWYTSLNWRSSMNPLSALIHSSRAPFGNSWKYSQREGRPSSSQLTTSRRRRMQWTLRSCATEQFYLRDQWSSIGRCHSHSRKCFSRFARNQRVKSVV